MEQWVTIDGYPHYEVSDYGNVRRSGRARPDGTPRSLKSHASTSGYATVNISKGDNVFVHKMVHRLVMLNFLEVGYVDGNQVNHIDGDKLNNRLENLEWCTQHENMAHASRTKLFPSGEQHHKTKLLGSEVLAIRYMYSHGYYSQLELANMYEMSQTGISAIVRRKTWSTW